MGCTHHLVGVLVVLVLVLLLLVVVVFRFCSLVLLLTAFIVDAVVVAVVVVVVVVDVEFWPRRTPPAARPGEWLDLPSLLILYARDRRPLVCEPTRLISPTLALCGTVSRGLENVKHDRACARTMRGRPMVIPRAVLVQTLAQLRHNG